MTSCSRWCSCWCEGNVEVIGKVRSECKKNSTFASSIYFFRWDPVLGGVVVVVKVILIFTARALYTIATSLKCPRRCLPRLRWVPPPHVPQDSQWRPSGRCSGNLDGNGDNWRKYPSISMEICETNALYMWKPLNLLLDEKNKRAPLMYEWTKDVISAHQRISRRKTSFPPTIAFRAERWKLSSSYAIILLRPPATLYRTISFLLLYI